MVSQAPVGEQFRFHVDAVFTVTGRGTVAAGYIESGEVTAGDQLQVVRANGQEGPSAVCLAIDGFTRRDAQPGQPAQVGIVFRELQISDFEPGDVIVSVEEP
ncbi:hypothetical protein [Nocardia sp. NPDC058666]|uniref:hypothetical protein n=1 Tax=unclassified Nocardia TaxID=2637762 RepID=UPI00365912AC